MQRGISVELVNSEDEERPIAVRRLKDEHPVNVKLLKIFKMIEDLGIIMSPRSDGLGVPSSEIFAGNTVRVDALNLHDVCDWEVP